MIHGGDIYHNQVELDLSVNINPLGIPKAVKIALHQAVENCQKYPDIEAKELVEKLAQKEQVPEETVLCGNGASELFMAVVHGLRPEQILIPVPSFYGYQWAAEAVGAEMIFYQMKPHLEYRLDEEILAYMTEKTDLLFLANPNNPTGKTIEPQLLKRILDRAKEKGIVVVLDECFLEFTESEEQRSQRMHLSQYPELVIVRAFTKIYAIPGVRLGYLLCQNPKLREKIRQQLPEWNISCFAQMAGIAALKEQDFIQRTVKYTSIQRAYLTEELRKLGLSVIESEADYLLVRTDRPLYDILLSHGILIRDCSNYKGLGSGYYRIAVQREEINVRLVVVLRGRL